MGVFLKNIKYYNEFHPDYTTYLTGNVGDKVTIVSEIETNTIVVASTDNSLIFNNNDGYIGDGWCTDAANRFGEFKIGDTIRNYNYQTNTDYGTATIIDKLDDGAIQLDNDFTWGANFLVEQNVLSVNRDYTALKLLYNFIEREEDVNYFCKSDGSEQISKAIDLDASVATPVFFTMLGKDSWKHGSIKVEGLGKTSTPYYSNKFKITHETKITPFLLVDQDLDSKVKPDYFDNTACLKYIFKVIANVSTTEADESHFLEYLEDGNTGWFDENFNTGLTNYFYANKQFYDKDNLPVDGIELTDFDTKLEVKIKNVIDNPFTNGSTRVVVGICQYPELESELKDSSKTLDENYLFDRVKVLSDSVLVNSDNFGGSYQIIKSAKADYVSTSELDITINFKLTPFVINTLSLETRQKYALFIATCNDNLDSDNDDRVNLLVDVSEFYINPNSDNLITIENKFIPEPKDTYEDGETNPEVFPHEEVTAVSRFVIDKTIIGDVLVNIDKITMQVISQNSDDDRRFELEKFEYTVGTVPIISKNQFIDFNLSKGYHVPVDEKFKHIKVKRREDLDDISKYAYEIYFPFLMRWEYWVKNANVNEDFFNVALPNNGQNNFWNRYDNLFNWEIFYEVIIDVTKEGKKYKYSQKFPLVSNDYDSNPEIFNHTIKSYNAANTELFDGVDKRYILGFDKTKIVAKFESNSPFDPDTTEMVIDIETFEQGGALGRRRISSTHAHDSDTWFLSTDGSKKIKLTFAGNTVEGECYVNHNALPKNKKFTISARLYVQNAFFKLFQDGDGFIFQDQDPYKFQDQ